MTVSGPYYANDDYAFDAALRLEDLVDRQALDELGKSVFALFGIPLRIFSDNGVILSDATSQSEVCAYVNTLPTGRPACSSTVSTAKATEPDESGEADYMCFTGAAYKIIAIHYDGRRIGKMVIGPYLPASVQEVPPSFVGLDPAIDPSRAKSLLFRMPKVKPETIGRIARHVKTALDLIFFSGHKTLLTSQMHLASVTESYKELQEKNARLQDAYDRLRELDRLKSNFLATVSHELRTPLTSIIGYSEMLTEGIAGPMSEEQMGFVRTIHEKGEHLLSLILSLLDLSKLESGTMRVKKRAFSIEAVLQEVLTTVIPNARKRGVEVSVDSEGPLPELRGDPERMRQVVLNLVDNAVKFTPESGRVTMRVRPAVISADHDEEDGDDGSSALFATVRPGVEVRIIDTGIGIPPSERPRIFDAFYQVDSSSTREYGGAGLGLAIVKRLVEAHGGTIHVEGNEPTGSIFIVRLPASTSPIATDNDVPLPG